jgi:hypothetical protein
VFSTAAAYSISEYPSAKGCASFVVSFTFANRLSFNHLDQIGITEPIKSARDILGKSTLKKLYFDRGFYEGEHFDWPNKNHIQFVCRGKQRTKVADQVSEILVEEYVEEILASQKEYQSKTERGKREKAKWDALKEPVKIAERMVDVTNCEKRLRAIAVKHKGKKSIDIWLTNIPASICSADGVIDEYRNRKHK